jgi:hypothetical protein
VQRVPARAFGSVGLDQFGWVAQGKGPPQGLSATTRAGMLTFRFVPNTLGDGSGTPENEPLRNWTILVDRGFRDSSIAEVKEGIYTPCLRQFR